MGVDARLSVVVMVATAFACSAAESNEARDKQLLQAGFVSRPVTTPDAIKSARKELVPYRFEKRQSEGNRYYLYYDPDHCKCLFAGSEEAMAKFKAMPEPEPPRTKITVRGSATASEERMKRLETMPLLVPTEQRRNAVMSANAAEELRYQNQSGFADVDAAPLFTFKY